MTKTKVKVDFSVRRANVWQGKRILVKARAWTKLAVKFQLLASSVAL